MHYTKTLGRAVGVFDTVAGAYFVHVAPQAFYNGEYTFAFATLPLSIVGLYLVADGISDVITGCHHYLGLNIWKRLTKSEKTKESIDADLRRMIGKD